MWLLTGLKKEEAKNYTLSNSEVQVPIEFHIKQIVKKQVEELSTDILQRLSNIEESIKQATPIILLEE